MSDKTKLRLFSLLVTVFTFVVPIAVVITTYFTIEQSPKIAWNIIGAILLVSIVLLWVRSMKKRIVARQQSGFKPSPYKVMLVNHLPPILYLGAFYWFLNTVENDITQLIEVFMVIIVSVVIAFVLRFFQTHYEIKLSSDE